MLKSELAVAWVVFRKTNIIYGEANGKSAVCKQGEWDAMELLQPGYNTLIRSGIANEAQAEMLARNLSGYVASMKNHRKIPRT